MHRSIKLCFSRREQVNANGPEIRYHWSIFPRNDLTGIYASRKLFLQTHCTCIIH